MTTKQLRGAKAILCVIVCATVSPAQTWLEVRQDSASYVPVDRAISGALGEIGSLSVDSMSNQLEWLVTSPWSATVDPATAINPVTCGLPFDLPAGGCETASPNLYLVSGASAATGHGFLVVVALGGTALSARSVSVVDSANYGVDLDPYEVAWNPADGNLYIYDFRLERVLVAPWVGTVGTLPVLSAFSVITNLEVGPDVRFEPLATGGVQVFSARGFPGAGNTLVEPSVGGGWVITPDDGVPQVNTVEVHNLTHLAAGEDVYVRSDSVGTLDVLDASSGVVLYTTALVVSGAWEIIPGSVFQLNGSYQCRLNGVTNDVISFPVKRWGDAGSSAVVSNVYFGRGDISRPGPHQGNDDFYISGWVALKGAGSVPSETALAVLMLGYGDGMAPVQQVGNITLMSVPIVIAGPWLHYLDESTPSASLIYHHPIPANPSIVGLMPIYQWGAFLANGEIATSDVFGSVVQ
jgi:hypothetical protein